MSAAEASGKLARIAPNAAYSIVVSSDTRNTAMLETQKIGQGETAAATGGIGRSMGRIAASLTIGTQPAGASR